MPGGLIILMILAVVMDAAILLPATRDFNFSVSNKFIMVNSYKTSFALCQREFTKFTKFSSMAKKWHYPDLLEII